MKLESLYEYVTLVKRQSFTEAARALYLSQSSLSSHIIAMEKELGFFLIDRSDKVFGLTPAGSEFLTYAQQAIRSYATIKERCAMIADKGRSLRISGVSVQSPYYRALNDMMDVSYEFVDLDLETYLFFALVKGIIDIGVCVDFTDDPVLSREAEEKGIAYLPSGMGKAAICMMRSHPLANKEALSRRDLFGCTTLINSGANFDSWKHEVLRMLGEDIGLEFRLAPIRHVSNLSKVDLGDCLHICGLKAVNEWFAHRDDIVIFDQLDGQNMLHTNGFVYLASNRRAKVLVADLCKAADLLSSTPVC
jgi:DNA-binding transcriptional LysR family regulator